MSEGSASMYDAAAMQAEAQRQTSHVRERFARLDDADFARRPPADGWSIGECLEHLALINSIYLDAIDGVIRDARERGLTAAAFESKRPKRHGWIGDAFVRSLEPPPRLKGGAFRRTIPDPQRSRAAVLADFLGTQERLARTIAVARDLDFARARMRSPFFRLVPLSLGQAFGAVLAHNRRHIWQAERILERKV